jgi:HK97 family phage major capsid protein
MPSSVLETLRARRDEGTDYIDQILADVEARATDDDPTPRRTDEERDGVAWVRALVGELDEEIELREDMNRRADAAARAHQQRPTVRVNSEPRTYRYVGDDCGVRRGQAGWRPRRSSHSFCADVWNAKVNNDQGSWERLRQHNVELERDGLLTDARGREVRADSTSGGGSTFSPPQYLIDEWILLPRPQRVLADKVRPFPLPAAGMTVSIPKLTGGTLIGPQTGENLALPSADITDAYVTSSVNTAGGYADISQQLIDRVPIDIIDDLLFFDMGRAYDQELNTLLWQGTGTNNQPLGLGVEAGTNSVAYTNGSPHAYQLWTPLGQATSKIAKTIYDSSNLAIFMHTLRWHWISAELDSSNRPLVTPADVNAFNALVQNADMAAAVGLVSVIKGLPTYADPTITTADTTGGGSGQDVVYVTKTDMSYLAEGPIRMDTFDQPGSATLTQRLRLFAYFTFFPSVIATATSVLAGPGLAAPSGY